jgi:hypothetical protein
MIRVVYIAGPYRHGDEISMSREVDDETEWADLVAACGHMWIAPLNNSVNLESGKCNLTPDEFIERDIQLINRLVPEQDILLCRPGALNTFEQSVGANRELEAAVVRGLLVFRCHMHDDPKQAFIDALKDLDSEIGEQEWKPVASVERGC